MAVAETARLIASLELKDLFSGKVGQIDKSLGKLNASIDHTSSRSYRAGQQIGTGIKVGAAIAAGAVGFLATNVAIGLRSLDKLDSTVTQTNAVLKSTKGAAGENAQAIRDLANKYEDLNATIDDTVIQSGENLLLTFTNIRTKAFEPALKAALDMNQALGGGEEGLQGTIQRLGKALNDPIKGLAQLGRVGVTFTKEQKDQITTAVKAGDTFKAQGIILAELNKRFGGSFLAGGQTTAGKVAKFKDAIDDLQRALATALLPVIGKVADALQRFLADPKVIAGVTKLGQDIAGLFSDANLAKGADFLKSAFATAQAAAPIVEQAAKATLGFVQAAVSLFKQLPAPLQGLLVGGFALNKLTGGLVTNIAGGLADLLGKSRGASPANPVFVADVSGGFGGAAAGAGKGLLAGLGTIATKLAGIGLILGGLQGLSAGVSIGGPAGAGVGALGGAATIGGAALLLGPIGAIAAAIGVTGKTLLDIRANTAAQGQGIADAIGKQIAGGASLNDLRTSLAAVDQGINDIQANPLNVLVAGDALDQLRAQHDLLTKQIELLGTANAQSVAANANQREDRNSLHADLGALGGKITDDLGGLKDLLKGFSAEFIAAAQALAHGRGTAAIIKAADAITALVGKGRGGAGQTENVLNSLKKQLANTHDPKLQAALRADIAKVAGLLPGRQFAAKELAEAQKILRSHESAKQKIVDLKDVASTLLKRGLTHAAAAVTQLIQIQKNTRLAIPHPGKEKDDLTNLIGLLHPGKIADDIANRAHSFTAGAGGSASGSQSSAGGGGLFVPTVKLDPSQVMDLRGGSGTGALATAIGHQFQYAAQRGTNDITTLAGKIRDDLLPGTKAAQIGIAKAEAILRSNESANQKINDLKAIERALKDRGLPHAAAVIESKIAAANRAQVIATKSTTQAVKDQDLSVSVVTNTAVNVSVRDIISAARTSLLAGNSNVRSTSRVNF